MTWPWIPLRLSEAGYSKRDRIRDWISRRQAAEELDAPSSLIVSIELFIEFCCSTFGRDSYLSVKEIFFTDPFPGEVCRLPLEGGVTLMRKDGFCIGMKVLGIYNNANMNRAPCNRNDKIREIFT